MNWYRRVFKEADPIRQLIIVTDACAHYEAEYDEAMDFVNNPSGLITRIESQIPGMAAQNEARVCDLEIMLKHLENMENCARKRRQQFYMENYQRTLSETTASKYADADDEVQDIRAIRYRVASVANMFSAVSKGLEYMHFQLSNITKLRVAGLEDSEL